MNAEPEVAPSPFGGEDLDRAMLKVVIEGYAEAYLREGRLDLEGSTDEEIFQSVLKLLQTDLEDTSEAEDTDGLFTITFEKSLLTEARRFEEQQKTEFAVTMYATWFEHWLNAMLLWGIQTKGLNETDARSAIREANVRAKTGYLWHLAFGEDLDSSIVKVILAVAERRNEFVHYKWADAEKFSSRRGTHVADTEVVIAMCLDTENRLLYGGSRERVMGAMRRQMTNTESGG